MSVNRPPSGTGTRAGSSQPQSTKSRSNSVPIRGGIVSRPGSASNSNNNNSPSGGAQHHHRQLISKDKMYSRMAEEFHEPQCLSKHVPAFSIDKQIQRDQRAKGMVRICDRTFNALTYNPKYNVCDKHDRIIDLKRHTGRKFDQSAGFFTPPGAHLTYHPEKAHQFLEMHMHGNVNFGRLPAAVPEPDRIRAKNFEAGITRRKHTWLHPNGEEPCPVAKLSQEERVAAVQPQKYFLSTRATSMEQKRTKSEVDTTCGSPQVVQSDILNRFPQRNKGHEMRGDSTREQRAKQGYESGKEKPPSCSMAPLRVKYSGVGGRGFERYVPIGEAPKSHISFGKARRLQLERKDQDAINRTKVEGNSEMIGNPIKAFDALRRKTWKNVSLGPGFKSAAELEDEAYAS